MLVQLLTLIVLLNARPLVPQSGAQPVVARRDMSLPDSGCAGFEEEMFHVEQFCLRAVGQGDGVSISTVRFLAPYPCLMTSVTLSLWAGSALITGSLLAGVYQCAPVNTLFGVPSQEPCFAYGQLFIQAPASLSQFQHQQTNFPLIAGAPICLSVLSGCENAGASAIITLLKTT